MCVHTGRVTVCKQCIIFGLKHTNYAYIQTNIACQGPWAEHYTVTDMNKIMLESSVNQYRIKCELLTQT